MDRSTEATRAARNQAAEARTVTPRQAAEADAAKEGARLGRLVAERELAARTLETCNVLKSEGRPVSPADYVIGTDHEGQPIDCRDVLKAARDTLGRGRYLGRQDGRMTAAELNSVVTAAARNVTAGIARRMNGATVGKLTAEDWQDLTSELTLAALAREAEAVAALTGETLAAALRGDSHRSNLDTLPRWATVRATEGDSPRSAWVKSLTANEGRSWARRRAESAKAAAAALEGTDLSEAAAQAAADDRAEIAHAEAREIAEAAAEKLGLGKQATEAAAAALDGLTRTERAKLTGRTVGSQKDAEVRGRKQLAAALGASLTAARRTVKQAAALTPEGPPLSMAALAARVDTERERVTDTLATLAEGNRALEGWTVAASLMAARSEAERYLILRAHYGAPVLKVTCKRGPALREVGPHGRDLRPSAPRAYSPRFNVADLAHLPERTPGPSIGRTLAPRTGPLKVTVGPSRPVAETCHVVTPKQGRPVKRPKVGDSPVKVWTCEGFRKAAARVNA